MKIFAIASAGGHWVQLLRLMPALENWEATFVTTNASFASTVKGNAFYTVPDANRWNKLKLIYSAVKICRLVLCLRPNVIITTGAAPGLMGVISGRLVGAKTIWVDSIANTERISMSGRLAVFFAHRVYTQWPHLASNKVVYSNSVLS